MQRALALTALITLFVSAGASAQSTDSLAQRLAAAEAPAERLPLLAALADVWRKTDFEAALVHAKAGRALAGRVDSTHRQARFALQIAGLYHDLAQYDSARVYLREAQAHFTAAADRAGQARTLEHLLFHHKKQGAYVEAMEAGLQAIRIWEELDHPQGLARAYAETSDVLYYQERYEEAVTYCERAIALLQGQDAPEALAIAYQYKGENHLVLGHYEQALADLTEALALRRTVDDPVALSSLYNSRGNLYKHTKRFEAALADYRQSLDLALPLNHAARISAAWGNIADVLMWQDKYEEALPYLMDAIRMQKESGVVVNLAETYFNAAYSYEALGRYPEALAYYKRFASTQDSLLNADKNRVMSELQTRYETERKENIIGLQEQQLARQRTVQRFSLGVLALLGIILFLMYWSYRTKQKSNALLAERAQEIEKAYHRLKTTQAQLVHAEKMASLGQLTAGIAHEIKNPLNFVNNFAGLSQELFDELQDAIREGEHGEAELVLADLKANAAKIEKHGKRADAIVRSMMEHASGGSGEYVQTDVNHLVAEHVDLAYHGKRAQMPDLTVHLEQTFDEAAGTVEMMPQDVGRVLLNLLGNAFDAVHEHAASANGRYVPTVQVQTRRLNGQVEIRVADNGPGIPPDIQDKIFEPFFTTKPTGSGTGLGLSLSYDIVTQGHGGTLTVESEAGKGATFILTLPVHQPEAEALS